MKFEVGKKYQRKGKSTPPFEILWVDTNSKRHVFRYLDVSISQYGSEWVKYEDYEEYREPVKRWVNVFQWTSGHYETGQSTYVCKEVAEKCGRNTATASFHYIKTIEIEI